MHVWVVGRIKRILTRKKRIEEEKRRGDGAGLIQERRTKEMIQLK